jgi:hypothetical protein
MVGSGLILWTVKRRAKLADPNRPHFGFRLVEKLNIGAIAGLPFAMAVYFLANRLLPVEGAGRSDREIAAFFIAWGAVFVWAAARPSGRAWVEALAAVAMSFALVPVINALTTDRSLVASLIAGDWVFAGFDATMLLIAAGFGWAASKALRRSTGPRTTRSKRPARSPSAEAL